MKMLILLTVINCLFLSFTTRAQLITLSAEGTKQGKFKGESNKQKFTDKSEITGYLQEVTSPRDMASGAATGKRVHAPIIILKQAGGASPQFFQALTTNEILKKVVIDFYKTDASGVEMNYYTVTLENVSVTGFKQFIGPLENEKFNPANNILYDEIKFSFQKITIENKMDKTIAQDDWNTRQ